MANVRKHVIIKGRVQGVFYRASTHERALVWGVNGWVKNTSSGRVEAVFEGDEQSVERLIRWCHKGPPGAIVRKVEVDSQKYTGEFSTFSIQSRFW